MENVMTAVMKALAKDMEGIEPSANMKMHQSIENCYSKSGNNPDRFADCIFSSNKKISDIVEPFQYKLLFISKSAEKCLLKNNEKKCIEEMTTLGKGIVQNMVSSLEKI
jgi:hypothetical protein